MKLESSGADRSSSSPNGSTLRATLMVSASVFEISRELGHPESTSAVARKTGSNKKRGREGLLFDPISFISCYFLPTQDADDITSIAQTHRRQLDERWGLNRKTKDLGGFASDLLY